MADRFRTLERLELCNELGSQVSVNLQCINNDLKELQTLMSLMGMNNIGLNHSLQMLDITIGRVSDLKDIATFATTGDEEKDMLYEAFLKD